MDVIHVWPATSLIKGNVTMRVSPIPGRYNFTCDVEGGMTQTLDLVRPVCVYQMTKSGNVIKSRRQGLSYGSIRETTNWLPAGNVAPVKIVRWLGKLGRVMSFNALPNIHAATFRIPYSALRIQAPVHIDLPYPCRISDIRCCTRHTIRMRRLNDG